MTSKVRLSKSRFLIGLQCAKRLWWTVHEPDAPELVVEGLARHIEEVGKPLCPCNFYPDKQAEAKLRRWICACDEMQTYKYCH